MVRERTFVPKGTGKISKPQMPPRTKEAPPNITNPRRPHQANQLQRHLIQKNYPRLQKCDRILIRLYVISDPSNVIYKQSLSDINGTLSVVWQQQGEKACIETYKLVHNDRPGRYYGMDYTAEFETQFQPLQLIEG